MTKDDVLFGYRQTLFAEAARTNISEACRRFGVHRSTYYAWKRAVERSGLEMLRPRERRRPRMPNQLPKMVEERIVAFVKEKGEAIVDEVADAVGVTRSTARKYLAGLVDARELKRTEGGRDRGRKRPDRFSVASGKRGEQDAKGPPSTPVAKERLGPGELDGLMLADMREHRDEAPHTPSRIGKRIGRSSGAIANCLRRLADSDRAVLASKKPRAYDLPEGE